MNINYKYVRIVKSGMGAVTVLFKQNIPSNIKRSLVE